jgi:F-type H+-transporting ATPase subunit b
MKLAAEIFAFLVVVAVLYRYVGPPLRTAMARRKESIRAEFEEARQAKEEAEAAEASFRASIRDAETEVAEIRDNARELAQQIVEELTAKAHADVDRIIQRAHQQLAADREALIRAIRAEMGALVVELAGRIVVHSLADRARGAATVDRFLAALDGSAATPAERPVPATGRI